MQKAKQAPWRIGRWGRVDEREHRAAGQDDRTGGGSGSGQKGNTLQFLAFASVPLTLVLGNSMLVPILPELQTELHVSKFQSSLVITLFSVTAGLFIPVLGYLSDRFSRKAVMIPSLILYGAAGILAGFGSVWGSYPILIGARALQGLGAAGTAPIAMALVGDTYSGGTESKALGLVEASNGAGKVISPILGSLLALIVWYAAFFAFPAFCLASLLGVIFLLKEPDKKKTPPKLGAYVRNIVEVFKKKGRWLVSAFVTGSLGLFILFGVLFYLSDTLEKAPHNIDGVWKGLVLAIPLLGMVVTSYLTGARVKKNGKLMRRLMLIGLCASTVALAASIWLHDNLWLFISLLTLSSIGTGLLLPCLNTMITGSVDKSGRGMITSLYSSLRFLGVAFGPPLFERMMAVSNELVFIVVSCLSLAALLLVFAFIRPEGKVA